MKLVVNEAKLYEIMKEFHQLTGLKVSFIKDFDSPVIGVPYQICELCRHKQQDRAFYLKCKESDKHAHAIASQGDDTYIYECHYHLTEALQPVVMYGRHVGYFLLGQMLTDREKFIRENDPSPYELSLADKLASPTQDMLRSAARILSYLAQYTVLSQHINLIAQQSFDDIVSYIDTHYAEQISVDGLCNTFHYSRPTLFMHFKKEFGMGIIAYINNLRLEKSAVLLRSYNVNETAKRVGFEDVNYFSRIFKKKYGMAPSAYAAQQGVTPDN